MEEIKEIKEIIKNSDRYSSFTLLDKFESFKDLFANQNIEIVQLHSTQIFDIPGGKDIVGFCGSFKWENNKIIPLDGDCYSNETEVIGFEWFETDAKIPLGTNLKNEKEIIKTKVKCLDILVGAW